MRVNSNDSIFSKRPILAVKVSTGATLLAVILNTCAEASRAETLDTVYNNCSSAQSMQSVIPAA